MKHSIVIVEDQNIFAESIKELLLTIDFIHQVEVIDPQKINIRTYSKLLHYDVVLLDINMPSISGFEIAELVRKQSPYQKIAFLSAREDNVSLLRAQEIGVNGYFFKSCTRNNLYEGLKNVLAGKNYFQAKAESKSNIYKFQNGLEVSLSKREVTFMEYLLQELTSKEIAAQMFVSEHTIIGYRKSLFEKLKVNNMVGLAKYAIQIV